MYNIIFYAPVEHVERIKEAMFKAGAGKLGNYACCAWQTAGEGQFMPLTGSDAFIGEVNNLEKVKEYKVEMVCETSLITVVVSALKAAHPYEVPAYQVVKLEDF